MKDLLVLAAILTAWLPAAAPAWEISLAGARAGWFPPGEGVRPHPPEVVWTL